MVKFAKDVSATISVQFLIRPHVKDFAKPTVLYNSHYMMSLTRNCFRQYWMWIVFVFTRFQRVFEIMWSLLKLGSVKAITSLQRTALYDDSYYFVLFCFYNIFLCQRFFLQITVTDFLIFASKVATQCLFIALYCCRC